MGKIVLAAKNRLEAGSAVARRLRRSGRIPGVMYGKSGKSLPLDFDETEFAKGTKGITESTIISLEIDGAAHDVFVKTSQRNIMDGKVLHVDFYEVQADAPIRAKISIKISGNPIGVREGGILEVPRHNIEVECLPKFLPERIEVDISGLKSGESIHVRDLPLDSQVKLLSDPTKVVAVVKYPKGTQATEAAGEEAKS